MTENTFQNLGTGLTVPAQRAFTITPGDELPHVTRGIAVNETGTVNITLVNDGGTVTQLMLAGVIYPLMVEAVNPGGTANDIIGYY